MGKNLSNKYSQKLLDSVKKSTTEANKTDSKRSIQNTAEAASDLIGNEIADKITSISKKSSKELQNQDEIEIPKERLTYLQKKDNKLLMNYDQYNNIILEYQKIINLIGNTPDQLSKFRTKTWIEINNQSRGVYSPNSDIRF